MSRLWLEKQHAQVNYDQKKNYDFSLNDYDQVDVTSTAQMCVSRAK